MPTLRPKLRKVPRRSFSMAMAFDCNSFRWVSSMRSFWLRSVLTCSGRYILRRPFAVSSAQLIKQKPAGAFTSAGQQASSLRSVALHYHGSVPFRYRFSLYAPIGTAIAEIRLLGISAASLRQAPPGQDISSPAAYFFGTVSALICGDGSPANCYRCPLHRSRPLGSCSRAADWSAVTSCLGP
jgi:hypothetical protein